MLYPLREAAPDVEFIAANEAAHCRFMKMITLPKLRDALRDGVHEVKVPAEIADQRAAPDRADGRDQLIGAIRSIPLSTVSLTRGSVSRFRSNSSGV